MPQFKGTVDQIEHNTNKVTTIDDSSTDTQYPSALAVNNALKNQYSSIEKLIGQVSSDWGNVKVVTKLPITGEDGKSYFVPRDTDYTDSMLFDEYVWAFDADANDYNWLWIAEKTITSSITVDVTDKVDKTTTIAGIDLKDNINKNELLNALVEDTGWQNLELVDGFSAYSAGYAPLRVRRIGKVVYLEGAIKNASEITYTKPFTIATLPEGFCPEYAHVCVMQGSGAHRFALHIEATGNIQIDRYTDTETIREPITAGAWLQCYTSWVVK